jgi:hypothetical protein
MIAAFCTVRAATRPTGVSASMPTLTATTDANTPANHAATTSPMPQVMLDGPVGVAGVDPRAAAPPFNGRPVWARRARPHDTEGEVRPFGQRSFSGLSRP